MNFQQYLFISKTNLVTGIVIFLAAVVFVGGYRISRLTNSKAISSGHPVHIYLTESVELTELSELLADSGVVDSKAELMWAGNLLGWKTFSRGHYLIEGSYSYQVFLSRVARGIQDPVSVTILPGITKERLVSNLSRQMKFDSLALKETINDSAFLADVNVEAEDLIGRIYPNTYSVYWTSGPEEVIRRIFREFHDAVYEPYKERFEELGKSVDEILTLASIIEWEASRQEEKPIVSGLYWNRLNRGMRLQADPTINFAVQERRRLLYEDYRIEHPYNTYIHEGLPPGPITNPGLSSIKAALYPEDHDYLFMVASPGGYHVFSETFEEHKKESARWRQWIQKQYRIKRRREAAAEAEVSS